MQQEASVMARTIRLPWWFGLALIVGAGLGLRLWAMRWPPFMIDMNSWIAWGEHLLAVGPRRFYQQDMFIDYPPGYLYVLWAVAALKRQVWPGTGLEPYFTLLRLIPALVDLATGVLLALVTRRAILARQDGPARARAWLALVVAAAYLFNPGVIFNSAVWGQIDSLLTLGLLSALTLALARRPLAAAVVYALTLLVKPQAISLAPLLAVAWLTLAQPWQWLMVAGAGLVVAQLALWPFWGSAALPRLYGLLNHSVNVYPYTSLFTYNLWGIYGMWRDDQVASFLGPSLRTLGLLLYLAGVVLGVALLLIGWRRRGPWALLLWLGAAYFAFLPVMVLTRMHERYLAPVLPLVLLAAVSWSLAAGRLPRAPRWMRLMGGLLALVYVVLSVVHALNLYQVYAFYRAYPAAVPPTDTLFHLVAGHVTLWSSLNLALFGLVTLALALAAWRWPGRAGHESTISRS